MAILAGRLRGILRLLAEDLDHVSERATLASSSVRQVAADTQSLASSFGGVADQAAATAEAVVASASSARQSAERDFGAASTSGRQAVEGAESSAAAVTSSSQKATAAAEGAATAVARATQELAAQEPELTHMEQLLEAMAAKGNAQLQSLVERMKGSSVIWDQIIERMLGEVELGVRKLDDFLRLFGDAIIATEDGTAKVRDLLDDLDPQQFIQQIIDLQNALHEGAADIEDVIAFLRSKNSEYARSLADLIQRVREGKATLEDLRRRAEQLAELYGDENALTGLIDQLTQEMANADAGGLL